MRGTFLTSILALGLLAGPLAAETAAPAPPPKAALVRLPKGTPVRVRMDYGVSAKAAREGDPVYLKVAAPVVANGVVIIPADSRVTARITEAGPTALVIDMEYVDTGEARIRLTGSTEDRKSVRTAGVDNGVVTVPLGGRSGKSVNIAAGTAFTAYTARDY